MTLWTTVLAAGRESSANAEDALARLCQTYWPPVYAYVRKRTPYYPKIGGLGSGRCSVVIPEHAAQPLSTPHLPGTRKLRKLRPDDLVLKRLVVSLRVVVKNEL